MAFVLSSVSGNLISAASAGYAPTNGGDVSAIASAYQVVSATGTQLYAGTAFLTGVNGAPVSADRAGQAANASLANSAWYDGTGRFISALPDSATVSAIASSYTTGKQDTLAFAYNTADQISSINGSALGGMDEAAVSGIASAYAEAAASGKLDSTAFNSGDFYSTSNPSGFITGVDLSDYATTGYVESSVSSKLDTTAFNSGDFYSTANPSGFITGVDLSEYATTGYVDSSVSGKLDSTAFNSGDFYSTANPSGFITGVDLSPYQTTADMSGYIPTSMSSDFQQVTGMSSYVPYSSIGYNTASAISGINGSALAGTTYSAGTGIDITDDVISVEAPVDIVAGPGIVIDNPDGNTLRVSQAQDIETVLWSNDEGTDTRFITWSQQSLSEDISHFGRVKFLYNGDNAGSGEWHEFDVVSGGYYTLQSVSVLGSGGIAIRVAKFSLSGTSITNDNNVTTNRQPGGTWDANSTTGYNKLYRIVGLNRISGGN